MARNNALQQQQRPHATLEPGPYEYVNRVKAFYSDHFVLPLPPGHRFPMLKYRLLRDAVRAVLPGTCFHEAPPAGDGELALAHHPEYVRRVTEGHLSAHEQTRIGFPWSPQMAQRARRSVGATIAACRAALSDGSGANLAGGTHHAAADSGAGFCVFNDAAVAARLMQAERRIERVAIIDLDVHQGDGTASILADDASVFTLSLHGLHNYPFSKACSDLDVGLADQTGDAEYLGALQGALDELARRFAPQLLIYLAGADPYQGDRLGRLALTVEGMAARDRQVFAFAKERHLPVALTMAGGYARNIEDTVALHVQSIVQASAYAESWLAEGA
jgi:acetoin utilization deacetylase AcuC-like enzyme